MSLPSLNSKYMNEATLAEQRWATDGFLDGLPRNTKRERDIRLATSVMLENQRLANEQVSGDATGSDDVAQFRRITIPMVRRFFPQLIAHHIVGVQPLIGPSGHVFYLRFRSGTEKGNQPGGDVKYPNAGWDANSLQQTSEGLSVVPVYYSHQRVHRESGNTPASPASATTKVYTLAKTPILLGSVIASPTDVADMDSNVTANTKYTAFGKVLISGDVVGYFVVDASGTVTCYTADGAPAEYPITAGSSLDLATGALTLEFNTNVTEPTLSNVCYEYNMECNADMPRITLAVESDLVESKTRKLRADWSIEAQQDLRAQHNLDVEAELTSFLAEEVNLEIDREIVTDVRDNAGTVAVWDYSTSLGDTIKEKYESLYVKIVEVSNQIHKKTLRSHANFIVASPEICAIFETATAGFAPSPSQGFESNIGIQYVGTVNGRFRVFKDPSAPQDQIVMGYRGDSQLDTGYFYCPYVALQQSPLLYDPETWCPRKGVMTRYGKILLRDGARFYARINLINFFI